MQKMIIALSLLLFAQTESFAQCEKKLILTSSFTEYLNSNGELERTEEEKSVIEINKSKITITPGSEENKMDGTITSDSCKWTIPFKEGKTIIKAIFSRNGQTLNSTITIEGKEGKVILLMEAVEMPDKKIRVVLDTFEEKK